MRRRYFAWTWLTLALVLTIYGGYSLIYSSATGKNVSVLGLAFFIAGVLLLIFYLVLFLISFCKKNKSPPQSEEVVIEEIKVDAPIEEPKEEVKPVIEEKLAPRVKSTPKSDVTYVNNRPTRSFSGGSGYVKRVGFGPVLRIEEEEILDMRSNTYYRIEGNMVKRLGNGPAYEISGNRIRLAFGGYLYEISGSNVNKTYGGFYASMSGGILQTHDLEEKYEIPSDLNLKQKLAVVALLFGAY